MKANRKFVNADEAVSPVIAVILMVAITVVLAATVFVLVSDIGSNTSKSAPAMSIRAVDSDDRLVVDSASSGADWNRVAIRLKSVTPSTAVICVGDDATGGNGATTFQNEAGSGTCAATRTNDLSTTADLEITGAADAVSASDYLDFCASAAATDVTVILIDTTANQNLGEWTLLTVGATCA